MADEQAKGVPPAGDGAALTDIALVSGIISVATLAALAVIVRYRQGGAAPLRVLEGIFAKVLRVPGWASIPAVAAIGAAIMTFAGAIWDIGVHIDLGRDSGPFGTTAHYPLLVGLVLVYLSGVLALGMTPQDEDRASRSAVAVPGVGRVGVGALLMLGGGGFALLGFPLDDGWHRLFGQDVTLWGPTHTMFFGGLIAACSGAVILMAEGARSVGREPFQGRAFWRAPLAGVLGGVFLFVGMHATDEFNWAVPQYRQVWQPLLLVFFAAFALVLTRALGGRGATVGALVAYVPLQLAEVVMIGALDTTQPATALFVVEALVVEAALWRAGRPSVRAAALAGLGVGTLGFAAEYGWSQVAMPLPWGPELLPEAIPTVALAGLAAGVLAALMAQALTGRLAAGRRPLVAALGAGALSVGLGVNAGITHDAGAGATATITLAGERTAEVEGVPTRVADLAVTLSDPSLAEDAAWAYVLGWQGGGRFTSDLVRGPDGVLRAQDPVPVGGTWKSFVRFHKGRVQVAAPVRMPSDPALDIAGFPAAPQATRPLMRDTELMQIERKDDGPTWAWTPAMLLVMGLNLALMAAIGAASVRAGRGVDRDRDRPRGGDRRTATHGPRRARRPALAGSGT